MNYYKFTSVLFSLLLAGAATTAQRYTDLNMISITPASGAVIANGDSAVVQLMLRNDGPDTLLTSDTMYILGDLLNVPPGTRVAGSPSTSFPPGTTAVMQLTGLAVIRNDRTASADTSFTRCIRVVTGNLMVPPVVSETLDTLAANNGQCITITLKGKPGPTAIGTTAQDNSWLMIAPNPAQDKITFSLEGRAEEPFIVTLSDVTGRSLVMKAKGQQSGGHTTWQMDVSRLAPGLYQARIQVGSRSATAKLMIRR